MPYALQIVNRFFPEVKTIKDARIDASIEVTQRDSSSATVKNHKACALAVACKRKLNLDGVIISVTTAYLVKDEHATRYSLPESVSREVVSFDRQGGFSPGKYELHRPSPTNRLGHRTGGDRDKKTGNGRRRKFRHMTKGIRTVLGSKDIS